ncbi:MAG: tRNA (N(6)-L-threonylcarbamoyladenosine(37)-C(2))-methylthiotransferase MtaB, partial [Bacteroidales bacterium]
SISDQPLQGMINFAGMKNVSFKTLGCRLNQYETDALVTQFHQEGYRVVEEGGLSDITVINTCTVTNQSDQKSRNIINQAIRSNPSGVVVVTGCMANNHRARLEANEKITYVVDNEHKSQIVSLVDAHLKGEVVHPGSLPGDVFGFEAVDKSLHTRTSIKVQDGCDNFCTYCIVPSVRGRAVSRPLPQILDNIRRVVDNGFREIVITGVNIGRYRDRDLTLEDVLAKIIELPGDFRVRISSMEPDGFGPDFHRLFEHPRMAPHLQSGSDPVLLRMRRMYTRASFMEILDTFRKHMPDFNFTTDVIVGFPGETEQDFLQTVALVREARFSHVHTFRYSRRKGTRADRMEDQVPEKVKIHRSEVIRKISEENREEYMRSMSGNPQRVLVEKVDPEGRAHGYGQHYLPVSFAARHHSTNRFQEVMITDVSDTPQLTLLGTPL